MTRILAVAASLFLRVAVAADARQPVPGPAFGAEGDGPATALAGHRRGATVRVPRIEGRL